MREPAERRLLLIQQDLTFEQLYQVLRKRWWWVALAIFLGAFVGLLLSFLLPATFQSTASLGIGIDYGRTHPLNREAERQALLQVQELLLSDEVLSAALGNASEALRQRNDWTDAEALREQLRLDRFEGRWDLSVYSRQPKDAAAMANSWSQASVVVLERALEAAWRARNLQQEIYELGCRLEIAEGSEQAVLRCGAGGADQAQELHQGLVDATGQSHGLLPALTFAALREAAVPSEPVYRARAWLALGGLLIGLVLGFGLLLAVPDRSSASVANKPRSHSQPIATDE